MATVETGSPDWWLARLLQHLMDRQERYEQLHEYAVGKHPVPNGDKRFVKALEELQKKAQTNYISLVLKAVTQRMNYRELKVRGEKDDEAERFWRHNNMDYQSTVAIHEAAKFGETYAMVSPPDPDDDSEMPVVTIEDPRFCIVEHDPINPMKSIAGLKVYHDDVMGVFVAILFLPDAIHVAHGPQDFFETSFEHKLAEIERHGLSATKNFDWVAVHDNDLDEIPLVHGVWNPATGFAECEDGAFAIQNRINHTMLDRLVITKSQAYRQRMVSGARMKHDSKSGKQPAWDPGSDVVWVTENPEARVWDLEQADIQQLLEAIRDDIGDLAALTQTPVTYLTNRMVNVSGDALHAAQSSHSAKVKERMRSMGWFFERIHRLGFRYRDDDERADELDFKVMWNDPEVRTMAEQADLAAKFFQAGIPLRLILETLGYAPDEIDRAVEEHERQRQEEMQMEREQMRATQQNSSTGSQSRQSSGSSNGNGNN